MIPADTVIAAIGEQVETGLFEGLNITLDRKGLPVVDEHMMTSVAGVYAAGDGRRGPASVVEAIADAAKACAAIAGISYDRYAAENIAASERGYLDKKGCQSRNTGVEVDRHIGSLLHLVHEMCWD